MRRPATRLRAASDWSALGLSPEIAALAAAHWAAPNAVQEASIPLLASDDGGDAVVGSETGSGKTLACLKRGSLRCLPRRRAALDAAAATRFVRRGGDARARRFEN